MAVPMTCTICLITKNSSEFHRYITSGAGFRPECKVCLNKIRCKARYDQNSQEYIDRMTKWKKANPEKNAASNAKSHEKNRQEINARKRLRDKNNRAKKNAEWANWNASKLKRMPKWLSKGDLIEISWAYEIAKSRSKETSIKYDVDHIVPLHGRNVSGLHVPWNLQILTHQDNMVKGRKF